MAGIYVIPEERRTQGHDQRRNASPRQNERRSGQDRRQADNRSVQKGELDAFLDFLSNRYGRLAEFIKDKEKKKLAIVGASFTVMSLVTSVLLGVVSLDQKGIDTLLGTPFTVLFVVVAIGVVFANAAIIKYVVSMKCQSLLATRQANCLRQAMHDVIFAKLEGLFPRKLNQRMLDNDDVKGSLLDQNTRYWALYGRHEKFPLDNDELRGNYKAHSIYFKSSDIFSIIAIAAYTLLLAVSPIVFLIMKSEELQFNASMAMFLGVICGVSAILLILFVVYVLRASVRGIRATLSKDELIHYELRKASAQ